MMKQYSFSLLVLFLLLCAGCAEPRANSEGDAEPSEITAFVGVNVVPMDTGRVLEDQTVIVRGEQIVEIEAAEEVVIPAGAQRINGRGKYLMPGLADMHVHLEYFKDPVVLRLFLANGVTTVRNMDGRPYILDWREEVAAGALLGPMIYTAGPILEGVRPAWEDTRVVSSPTEARAAVAGQAEAGYDFIKVYHTLSAEAYRAIIDEARKRGLAVAGHVPIPVGLKGVLEADQASIEHLQGYDEVIEAENSPFRGRWHWSKLYLAMPIDSEKVRGAAERTAEAGVWNVPALVQKEKLAPLEVMQSWLEVPEMAYVPVKIKEQWNPENWDPAYYETIATAGPKEFKLLKQGKEHRQRMVKALHDAGAGLLAGTDTPNPFVIPGFSIHEELQLLVEAGLTPYGALSTSTRNVATFLGIPNKFGTVTVGARADLVLLDANPLEDIHNTTKIEGVMVRGEWLPESALQDMLEDVAGSYEQN